MPFTALHGVNFNPRSPHRERRTMGINFCTVDNFNPRSPHRERPALKTEETERIAISIHAPLTGSDLPPRRKHCFQNISIHAPLTGSDIKAKIIKRRFHYFNPRSPHRERHQSDHWNDQRQKFQSTLPSQGATERITSTISSHEFQSTLPSQGATPELAFWIACKRHFNPRSPHRERHGVQPLVQRLLLFQSTLPSQGATAQEGNQIAQEGFQSTLPSQGAMSKALTFLGYDGFQSTLPSQGATNLDQYDAWRNMDFNPRSPHRERQK